MPANMSGDNKLLHSQYKSLAWSWLQAGQSPNQVKTALENMGFSIALPAIYRFKEIMENEIVILGPSSSSSPEDINMKNDCVYLDALIERGLHQLREGQVRVTPPMVLKALDTKRAMVGAKYKGDTLWGLLDITEQFDTLIDVLNAHLDRHTYDLVIEELEKKGFASTSRPAIVEDAIRTLSELKEVSRMGSDSNSDLNSDFDLEYEE